jgi:hypothetical protein
MIPNRLLVIGILLALVLIIPVVAESPYGCYVSSLNETSWIKIDPTGNYNYVGDNVTITGITNLEDGKEVLVEVYGVSYCMMKDYCACPALGGAKGTVTVEGGNCGLNQTLFSLNTTSFTPGEYLVTEQAGSQTTNDSALLILLAPATYNASVAYDECVAARSQTSEISSTKSSDNGTSSPSPEATPRELSPPVTVITTTQTPRLGLDAIPVLGAFALCGAIFLFRKKGN